MNILGIIPARYESTRFPGKPLIDIDGKSMIQHVYKNAKQSASLDTVVVATDDQRIYDHVKKFGGEVVMTDNAHQSGTDRCGEVIKTLSKSGKNFDIVINIQGDEPFLDPSQIELLINCFRENSKTQIATLVKKIEQSVELFNPNIVKVIIGINGDAIYFSRSPIPFARDVEQNKWLEKSNYLKHIGIYGYQASVLMQLIKLKKTDLEISENLEQLRWIENGYKIKISFTSIENAAIDTPDDLKKLTNKS
ncbi:MAG: 3-deoxy-manno-octulosonate cytidylyltransferase [Bacteroidetes bacterium]|nr:3-deoxy-manno-octulosonate cytidylyltransferase [Bacteroidota bacterium]